MNCKKLIEVALPLQAINEGSKPETENPFLQGHPRSIHNWWARTPLSVCRAVLFAQLIDDPGEGLSVDQADKAREPLLNLVSRLGTWEATNDDKLLNKARELVIEQFDGNLPAFWDMFAGRGSISIEAQRLGLDVFSSDLNPVAVTIEKALLYFPSHFAGLPPVNPGSQLERRQGAHWRGERAEGLATDIVHYGEWIRTQAVNRIGHLYPKAKLPDRRELPVIAWLWARSVKCPSPACGAQMPLIRSFALSNKKGKATWIEPVVNSSTEKPSIRFEVKAGGVSTPNGTKERGRSRCLVCGTDNISDAILREQAQRYGIDVQPLAVVAEEHRGRIYLPPEAVAYVHTEVPGTDWLAQPLPDNARWFSPPMYGLREYKDLFTPRQMQALTVLADLVGEVRDVVTAHAESSGFSREMARL
jgi:putative DNA methylase